MVRKLEMSVVGGCGDNQGDGNSINGQSGGGGGGASNNISISSG